MLFFFFKLLFVKQKTAYEMRISDWSSDVCSSDLLSPPTIEARDRRRRIVPGLDRPHRLPARRSPATPRVDHSETLAPGRRHRLFARPRQIGRASCRERVCQYM